MSSLRHKKMQFSSSAVFPLFIYLQNRQRPKFHFLLFPSSTELANTQFYLKEFADLRRYDLLACSWKQTVIIKGKSMGHSPLKTELTRHSAFPLKNFLWGFKGCYEPSSSINTLQCHGKPSKAHPDPHIGTAPHQGRQTALASKKQYNARQGPKVPQNLDLGQSVWIKQTWFGATDKGNPPHRKLSGIFASYPIPRSSDWTTAQFFVTSQQGEVEALMRGFPDITAGTLISTAGKV